MPRLFGQRPLEQLARLVISAALGEFARVERPPVCLRHLRPCGWIRGKWPGQFAFAGLRGVFHAKDRQVHPEGGVPLEEAAEHGAKIFLFFTEGEIHRTLVSGERARREGGGVGAWL